MHVGRVSGLIFGLAKRPATAAVCSHRLSVGCGALTHVEHFWPGWTSGHMPGNPCLVHSASSLPVHTLAFAGQATTACPLFF